MGANKSLPEAHEQFDFATDSQPRQEIGTKQVELIVQDATFEEGLEDGELLHLYLDKEVLQEFGHEALTGDTLERILTSVRSNSKKERITKITLEFNQTRDAGIGDFLRKDTECRELRILEEDVQDLRELCSGLVNNTTLERLLLGGIGLGDECGAQLGAALRRNGGVTSLSLLYCDFGGKGAPGLADGLRTNKSITTLDLAFCRITDRGARALAGLLQESAVLTELNLGGNSIGADGAAAMSRALEQSSSSKLATFVLSRNNVGGVGATCLARMLGMNTSISRLSLANNAISNEGGEALSASLKANSCLRQLDLRRNPLSMAVCHSLRKAWEELHGTRRRGSPLKGDTAPSPRPSWHDGLSLPKEPD